MENDRADGPERVRLPGFEDPAESRRPAYISQTTPYGPPGYGPPPYGPPGYPWPMGYARDDGIRRSRRTSSWTAAALIAGVAATTGYLAHAIPSTGAGTGASTAKKTTHHGAPKTTAPVPSAPYVAPYVAPPVTTSGGSGGRGGGGGDN